MQKEQTDASLHVMYREALFFLSECRRATAKRGMMTWGCG